MTEPGNGEAFEMKKVLLRNMWIIALAMVPATMAQSIYVSAAEIPCAFEEVNSAESAEETAEPEETVLTEEMLSSEETILPEGGEEVVPSAEGAILAEAADPAEGGEEVLPAEGSVLTGETDPVEREEEGVPAGGEVVTEPAEGETEAEPAEGENIVAPVEGENTEAPANGETVAAPVDAGSENAIAEGETPASEETANPPAAQMASMAAGLMGIGTEQNLFDRIHFIRLKDPDAASDSILIESNGHYGLVDASHPSWDPNPAISGYTADVDNVIEYLHKVGVMHLDFILGTHAHSDHIGGMKFIASARNSEGDYWVDSDTVYYYKQYYYNEKEEDHWGWDTTRIYEQAVDAMTARGAIMVDTSDHDAQTLARAGATFVRGGSGSISDSIEFTIGNFMVSLFNLYHNSDDNENLNSIVSTVTKDDRTTILMADLETAEGYERGVADAVAAKYGNADVIKVAHHGYDGCTSKNLLDTIEPSYLVTTSNRTWDYYDDEPPYHYYMKNHGITAYRAAEQVLALVEDLTGEGINFWTYDRNGALTANPVQWKVDMPAGWKSWYRDDDTYDYIYVYEDGSVAKGWKLLTRKGKTSWYLFDDDGVTLKGFQQDGQYTYYLNAKGEMETGWVYDDDNWYYMNNSGAMQYGWLHLGKRWFYLDEDGVMQTRWFLDDGKWYYFDEEEGFMRTGWVLSSGRWYFLNDSGVMLTGWVNNYGKWYYMDENGAMLTGWVLDEGTWYYLGSSGAMLTGWVKTGGRWYFMDAGGAMLTGWVKTGGRWYYMNENGAMLTGWQLIDGVWYELGASGAWTGGVRQIA